VSIAKSMKTAPLYAGSLSLPGKIISLLQGVIMHEMSGGLPRLPLIHGVLLKVTPRLHDLQVSQIRRDVMTCLLFLFKDQGGIIIYIQHLIKKI